MVGDVHVPAAGGAPAVAAAAPDVDALPDELAEDELVGELTDEGAVGRSRLLLFENWQPVSTTDAARVAANAQIFLVISRYVFVCVHTVLMCAINSNP
jgi:hypothetical protein